MHPAAQHPLQLGDADVARGSSSRNRGGAGAIATQAGSERRILYDLTGQLAQAAQSHASGTSLSMLGTFLANVTKKHGKTKTTLFGPSAEEIRNFAKASRRYLLCLYYMLHKSADLCNIL